MKLRALAHSRTGDKGNTANISLIAHDPADYPHLERHVTAERVRARFAGLVQGEVIRYALPGLGALNFVMTEALSGGVTRSLALDAHGKGLERAPYGHGYPRTGDPRSRDPGRGVGRQHLPAAPQPTLKLKLG